MRGGLYFVFGVSAVFFLLGAGLIAAWLVGDPHFLLGNTAGPPDPAEFDQQESQVRAEIDGHNRLILRLKENIADLPADTPAAQRIGYEKRLKDAEDQKEKAVEMLALIDSTREEKRVQYIARIQNAREQTLTRGIFLIFIGVVGMVRFREALTGAPVT